MVYQASFARKIKHRLNSLQAFTGCLAFLRLAENRVYALDLAGETCLIDHKVVSFYHVDEAKVQSTYIRRLQPVRGAI